MRDNENRTGLAARVLAGARNFLWQDEVERTPDRAAGAALQPPPADDKLAAELQAVVMSRPTAYSAFADALAALASIPMDEATRYRSAFAVLGKTQQRTVEQMAQAVDIHLGLLQAEQARFAEQSKTAEQEQVGARLQQAAALDAAAAEAGQRAAKLRADTEAMVAQIERDAGDKRAGAAELAREAEARKREIAHTAQQFAVAAEAVKSALCQAKDKLRQYLQPAPAGDSEGKETS